MNVSRLTGLINNGWNITNRRLLASKIGSAEMEKLIKEYEKICPIDSIKEYCPKTIPELCVFDHVVRLGHDKIFSLVRKGNDILLKLGVDISNVGHVDPYIIFKNNEITVDNIRRMLGRFRNLAVAKYGNQSIKRTYSLKESGTLKKIFSPEFKTAQKMNKDGYFVTTVINKKNDKPVKAYVKQLEKKKGQYTDITTEEWGLFVRHNNGDYEMIGKRSFGVDPKNKTLISGWMDSYNGGSEYGGVGVRLHQIGIERALQENLNKVEITALDEAFPFHYKCGFRSAKLSENMSLGELDMLIKETSDKTCLSPKEVKSCIVKTIKEDGTVDVSAETLEKILKLSYEKSGIAKFNGNSPMELEGKALEEWAERIKNQSILGSKK